MKSQIEKRLLSTYCPVSREEFLKILNRELSAECFELFLLMRFAAIDWKESEKRGQVKVTVRGLQSFLGWTLGSTARRIKKLQKSGLVKLLSRGCWQVSLDGQPFCSPIDGTTQPQLQHSVGINGTASSNQGEQLVPPKRNNLASKRRLIRKERKEKEEKEEEGFKKLTAANMKWIDKNIVPEKRKKFIEEVPF